MNKIFAAGFIVFVLLALPLHLFAHCDTLEGPVIKDARMALETKDVIPVLKWVSEEHEGRIKTEFDQTLHERTAGGEFQQKADMEFFETLVQIHREGEGAPFTGIKPAGTPPEPIILAADEAIETGSVDSLTEEIASDIAEGIHERFRRVVETKKHMNENVEAGREYVAAYVEFTHYAEGIHNAVSGPVHHAAPSVGTQKEESHHRH